jgi:choline dehydrogenase-like flavoprotein
MEFLLFAIGNSGGGQQTISIQFAIQHPYSQGRMYITTNDAFDAPSLDPRLLTHPADVILLRQAVKFARKIAATPPLSTVLGTESSPGLAINSDADIDAFIAGSVQTEFHPANTLAMLPRAQGGVVDSRLKVYGLGNVRVVDASVFPLQFAAHMQFPVYALAEAGAEIIRTQYNGVPDPFGSNPPSGGNPNNDKNSTSTSHKGGALLSSAPSVFTSAVAIFFALLVVVL